MTSRTSSFARRSLALVGLTAAAALVLAGCAGTPEKTADGAAAPKELTTIRYALNSSVGMTASQIPLVVADELGFFADEGLSVEALWPGASGQAMQTLASGQADIVTSGPEAFFSAVEQGQDVTMVYSWMRTPIYELALNASSPITDWSDLAGKKIGVVNIASGGKLMTDVALEEAGLNPATDVEYVVVGTGIAAWDALERGRIDALMLWTAEYHSMERLGADMKYLPIDSIAGLFSNSHIVATPMLKSDPESIEAFGRAWTEGMVWAQENPQAALELMWEKYPESKIDAESDQERSDYQLSAFKMDNPVVDSGDYGTFDEDAVVRWSALAKRVGLLTADVDTASLFTNEFAAAYNDFDAKAIAATKR